MAIAPCTAPLLPYPSTCTGLTARKKCLNNNSFRVVNDLSSHNSPDIRIQPDEVHINGSCYFDEAFNQTNGRAEKALQAAEAFGPYPGKYSCPVGHASQLLYYSLTDSMNKVLAPAIVDILDRIYRDKLKGYAMDMANPAKTPDKTLESHGYIIPAGTTVRMTAFLTHQNEDLYPEKQTFRPEGWLSEGKQPERYLAPFDRAEVQRDRDIDHASYMGATRVPQRSDDRFTCHSKESSILQCIDYTMFAYKWKPFFYTLLTLLTVCVAQIPQTDYDVIIIGGGPSGRSAASALSRVPRKNILFDSGEYRNNPTRHMHDVIGNDHKKVRKLEKVDTGGFRATVDNKTYTARKVILGSWMRDDLPSTPGLREGFGKVDGCSGRSIGSVRCCERIAPDPKDIRIYASCTNTTEQRQKLNKKHPNWQKVFQVYNVTINNKVIVNITRIQNGSEVQDPTIRREFDKFRIYFKDNTSEVRNAFITNYGTKQASDMPRQLGVVYGVGDANSDNSDNSTNVHMLCLVGRRRLSSAMEELDRDAGPQKRDTELDERSLHETTESQVGNEIEDIYKRMSRP
ncbi:hypothetical protein BBP40_011201 [Aspergillus hancockii]|nr:hypothetical protein BBP40_011201 [Aspergillus hancockii]